MEPIKFKEATKCLSKPQSMTDEECNSLWVYSDGNICISLWKLSFAERLKALFFGKIWLGILSGQSQPPVWISAMKTVFEKRTQQKENENE